MVGVAVHAMYQMTIVVRGSKTLLVISSPNHRSAITTEQIKLAPSGTDGRLFATDICAKFKVT